MASNRTKQPHQGRSMSRNARRKRWRRRPVRSPPLRAALRGLLGRTRGRTTRSRAPFFASPRKGSATDDKTWMGLGDRVAQRAARRLPVAGCAARRARCAEGRDRRTLDTGGVSLHGSTSINAALEGAVALTDRRSLTPRVPHFATERCWTLEHLDRAGHADAAAWTVALLASLDDALRHAGVGGRQQAP
jgi:hypothetical protein